MNLPKLSWKYYLLGACVVLAVIYSQREGISEAINGLFLFAQQNWLATAGILVLLYVAYWLSQQWQKRLVGEMPPAAEVIEWCCYNSPDFKQQQITYDNFDWENYEPLIVNNRLTVKFRRVDSGQLFTARIDISPGYKFKVTSLEPGWHSMEQCEKMSRPEMLYEAAKVLVKETEESFQEKKEEV
jgi:hypothetical protein